MSIILICGLNGSGKTTLGRELANVLGYSFLNDEDYYFLESDIPFSKSRSDEESRAFVLSYLRQNKNCVIVASRGDLGVAINSMYDVVVCLSAPIEARLARIKKRDLDKYGERVLEGGDMYEQQCKFYQFAASRTTEKIERWLETLSCQVIKLDGTKDVMNLIDCMKAAVKEMGIPLERQQWHALQ